MNNELDDLAMEYERVHASALITEKRGKNFDKVLGEWQSKAADVSAEVAASQDEGRNYTSELFRLKAAGDEGLEQLDIVKRENKNLADEIKDLLDQLGEGGRSIHDLDKQRRRLEQEKEELQGALERLRAPSSRRRTRSFVPSLSLDRSSRRLTGVWPRRKRSSTTPGRTTPALWSRCLLLLRLSRRPRARPSASRRPLRVRSTSSRLVSTMPTRLTLRV